MDFELIIIGTSASSYALAKSCFIRYHKKAYIIGNNDIKINSQEFNYEYYPNLDNNFVNILKEYSSKFSNKYLILVSPEKKYIKLIINNEKVLKKHYLFNYCDKHIYEKLTDINSLNELLKEYNISFPQAYVQKLDNKINSKNIMNLGFPLIITDIDNKFIGNVNNKDELKEIIKKQKLHNKTNIIVKKVDNFVENLCYSTLMYSSNYKKTEFSTMSCAELYQNNTYKVLINGYNIDNKLKNELNKVRNMLDNIGYSGLLEFIWQYNKKDNRYILIDINLDIPLSSYMLINCGYNIIERLVENLMYHKYYNFEYINYEICQSLITKRLLFKNIKNEEYKKEINKLIKMNKFVYLDLKFGGKHENRNSIRS